MSVLINENKEVITKTNVYINGVKIGNATFTSPELKFKKIEVGGAAGEYDMLYGAVEKLEASAVVNITNPDLYAAIALNNYTPITFTKALSTATGVKGRRDVVIGHIDIKEKESKAGEVYELELTIHPWYWLKELGGKSMVEIDKKNDIVKIGEVDLLENIKNVVGA